MDSVTIGRVTFVPLKGITEKLKDVVESKFNGGEIKYAKSITMPPARFEVELIVDDDCEVCPYAVEFYSELASKFDNVHVTVYNITYVPPPQGLEVPATPVTRINRVQTFVGIPLPLDTPQARRFFEEKFKEAYVRSHPKLHELTERLRTYAEAHGYRRNPNDTAYLNLLYKLLLNIDRYGYPYCPCRPLKIPPGVAKEQIYELNKDKVCPCIYAPADIARMGHCLCGIFWSKEKVDEYVKQRIEKYGWIIQRLDRVKELVEELKKRVISGRSREVADTILNELQGIYSSLPED